MNTGNRIPRHLLEDGKAQGFIRVDDVYQVMRRARHFLLRGLGSADVHAAVEQARIDGDDLSGQFFGESKGKFCFADGGGSNNEDDGRFCHDV